MDRRTAGRLILAVSVANVASSSLLAGIPGRKAVYQGGTLVAPLARTEGVVSTSDPDAFVFAWREGMLRLSYDDLNLLEYGQKAGRRLALGIVVSPLFLLSKKRKHYLTVGFVDAHGEQQAAVFELGKKIVRTTLAGLEARTGLAVQYQDEEARKASAR